MKVLFYLLPWANMPLYFPPSCYGYYSSLIYFPKCSIFQYFKPWSPFFRLLGWYINIASIRIVIYLLVCSLKGVSIWWPWNMDVNNGLPYHSPCCCHRGKKGPITGSLEQIGSGKRTVAIKLSLTWSVLFICDATWIICTFSDKPRAVCHFSWHSAAICLAKSLLHSHSELMHDHCFAQNGFLRQLQRL